MLNLNLDDTICAQATAPGHGGIAVVRVSGPNAANFIKSLMSAWPQEPESHRIYYGYVVDPRSNKSVDEVLAAYFSKGRSFTGDETVEISCHGGPVVVKSLLKLLLDQGCRLAGRGEFTYRAFMNGRIDLVQAESILSLIKAKTSRASQLALRQLEGGLSQAFLEIEQELVFVLAHLEAQIDFSDEDIEPEATDEIFSRLKKVKEKLVTLAGSYEKGRVISEGLRVAIVGKPNVGKSSLLNALLKEERAIVTEQAGTTRDVVSGNWQLGSANLSLLDTAGIRETEDIIEIEGIRRTRKVMGESDLVFYLLDASREIDELDLENIKSVPAEKRVVVLNKSDKAVDLDKKMSLLSGLCETMTVVSATSGIGLKGLEEIVQEFCHSDFAEDSPTLIQSRHFENVNAAIAAVSQGQILAAEAASPEFVVFEVQSALLKIQEVLGKSFDDDVLDRVFSEFCLGK